MSVELPRPRTSADSAQRSHPHCLGGSAWTVRQLASRAFVLREEKPCTRRASSWSVVCDCPQQARRNTCSVLSSRWRFSICAPAASRSNICFVSAKTRRTRPRHTIRCAGLLTQDFGVESGGLALCKLVSCRQNSNCAEELLTRFSMASVSAR